MAKPAKICVLAVLIALNASELSATALTSNDVPSVSMDSRFSGFDTIDHIKRNHRSLALQAENYQPLGGLFQRESDTADTCPQGDLFEGGAKGRFNPNLGKFTWHTHTSGKDGSPRMEHLAGFGGRTSQHFFTFRK